MTINFELQERDNIITELRRKCDAAPAKHTEDEVEQARRMT